MIEALIFSGPTARSPVGMNRVHRALPTFVLTNLMTERTPPGRTEGGPFEVFDRPWISVTVNGRGLHQFYWEGKRWEVEVREGSALLCAANLPHRVFNFNRTGPLVEKIFHFNIANLSELDVVQWVDRELKKDPLHVFQFNPPDLEILVNNLDRIFEESVSVHRNHRVLLSLLQTFFWRLGPGRLPRKVWENESPRVHEVLFQVISYLEQSFFKDISTQDILARIPFSRSKFFTIFKRHTGRTFESYLKIIRLEKSREALLDSGDRSSIKEIAYRVGFKSIPHFNRVFKAHFGLSPGDLKAR